MRAVIDADVVVYQACMGATAVAEHEVGGDLVLQEFMSVTEAGVLFDAMIETVRDQCEAEELLLCLSGADCFRKEIYPDYKKNRKGARPIGWSAMRGHAQDKYGAIFVDELEGDDLVGIHGSEPGSIICSIDKDLKTIPGMHLDKDTGEVYEINEDEANRYWMMQTLTGDATDGYPGCPTIGKVRAERILDAVGPSLDEMWQAVVAAYDKQGLDESAALTQARLARILRPCDYASESVTLWTPSKKTS